MARRTYTDAEKADALELYEQEGPSAVERTFGIAKGTVTGWAQANGIRTVRNERTAAAVEARSLDVQERKAALAAKLLEVAEMGLNLEVEILATKDATLRDVVGARTRAIHDLQLLSGDATSRTETVVTGQIEQEIARLEAELLDA